MKKIILSAIVAGITCISLHAQTNQVYGDTIKTVPNKKTDTIRTVPKSKPTGAVFSETTFAALGSFEDPLTDTVKTKVKSDTIKTGSVNKQNSAYTFIMDVPQTDTIKTKPQTDTIQTVPVPKMTGSIQVEHTNACVALLLSEIEEYRTEK